MEVEPSGCGIAHGFFEHNGGSLAGLGLGGAVLGVVITMGALGGPPEEIGHKVAAALVGTFLGILLCYGFFCPIASNMARQNEANSQYYYFRRVGVIAVIKGSARGLAGGSVPRFISVHT